MTSSKCLCRRAGLLRLRLALALRLRGLARPHRAFGLRGALGLVGLRAPCRRLVGLRRPLALAFSSLSAIDLNSRALGEADLLVASPILKPTRVGLPSFGSASARLDRWIGASLETMPPSCVAVCFWWRLTMLMPRTSARLLGRTHLDHLAGAALVAPGDDHDLVALADLRRHHSTSGASEMIFMWFLARSSRGTGPKMRVPTGSICG